MFRSLMTALGVFALVVAAGSVTAQQSNPANSPQPSAPTSTGCASDPAAAYAGSSQAFGTSTDPLVGHRIGGVNVFGGGLALYDQNGTRVGGVGVSGDTSCRDHMVAWELRHNLNLDFVPAGVSGDNA